MSDQPKALRLADDLENYGEFQSYFDEIAAELRRLHAENEALREANEAFGKRQEWWNEKMVALEERNAVLVEALRKCDEAMAWDLGGEPMDTLMVNARNAARAALAKVETSK